ncbi:hypothetical protein E4U21_004881 [Claviceps maximensis]|nr:hypothetical protein E4U21_004881 [Claviceps maximensis]
MHLGTGVPHRPHPGLDRMPPPSPSGAQPLHAGIMPVPNAERGFSNTTSRPPSDPPQSYATMAQTRFRQSPAPLQQPVPHQTPFSRSPVPWAIFAQQASKSSLQLPNSLLGEAPIHQGQVQTQMPLSLERSPRHGVEIFDLRHETMTEADARLLLCTYIIIRMQKSYSPNETNEIGIPLVPNWERITSVEQTEISQQEAARKVRELDAKGISAINKKNDMPFPLQRQIEKAQERLQISEEDNRYEYVLAQLDCKMREIDETSPLYKVHEGKKVKNLDRDKDRDKSKSKYKNRENDKKMMKKKGRDGEKKGKSKEFRKFERVSVTAYFRRVPRQEVNAVSMFQEKQGFKWQQSAQSVIRHMEISQQHRLLPPDQFPSHLARQMMPPAEPSTQASRQIYPAQTQLLPSSTAKGSNTADDARGSHENSHLNVRPHIERPSTPRVCEERPQSLGSSYMSDEDWDSEASDCVTPVSSTVSSSQPNIHKSLSKSRTQRSNRENEWRFELVHQRNKRARDAATPSTRSYHIFPSSRANTLPLSAIDLDSIKKIAYEQGLSDAVASLQPLVVQNQRRPLSREVSSYEVRRSMQKDRLKEIGEALGRGIEMENRRSRGHFCDRDRHYDLTVDQYDHGRQLDSRPCRHEELLGDVPDKNDPEIRWAMAPRAQSYERHRDGRAERQRLNSLAQAGLYYRR